MNLFIRGITISTSLLITSILYLKYLNTLQKNKKTTAVKFIDPKANVIYYSDHILFHQLINFIYKKFSDKINDFSYVEDKVFT